jgi:hypothetical protein
MTMEDIRDGLWRWETPHPEWRTKIEWGHRVACYALSAGDDLVLVDPLAPADDDSFWPALDRLTERHARVAVFITIPYHVRSAADVHRRYAGKTSVHGHRAVAKRLPADVPLEAVEPGAALPGGVTAHKIGKPRRYEMPLLLPSHGALAFGDAVVAVGGELRVWDSLDDPNRRDWYENRFLPTLRPLLDLPFRHVLATHGPPIMDRGKEALAAALEREPWSPGQEIVR